MTGTTASLIVSITGLCSAVTALIWNYLHSKNHK